MTAPFLEVRGLTKIFSTGSEPFTAVAGIGFSLERGGSLGVVGESGSGKTTTARMIAGLEAPTAGQILVDGRSLGRVRSARERRSRARIVQMVFQDPFGSLDPRQTLGSALAEMLTLHFALDPSDRSRRIKELLEQVGLDAHHEGSTPGRLSGGQRQRFAIARALALEPDLLILDEAVSALDVSVQAQVLNLLSDVRRHVGVTFLFVSHDLAVVRQVTDTCVVMRAGAIVEQGPTAALLAEPRETYTRQLIDAIPRPGWKPRRQQQHTLSPAGPQRVDRVADSTGASRRESA